MLLYTHQGTDNPEILSLSYNIQHLIYIMYLSVSVVSQMTIHIIKMTESWLLHSSAAYHRNLSMQGCSHYFVEVSFSHPCYSVRLVVSVFLYTVHCTLTWRLISQKCLSFAAWHKEKRKGCAVPPVQRELKYLGSNICLHKMSRK